MSVRTEKGSEVRDLEQNIADTSKIVGYNESEGTGMFTFSRLWNWIKSKTRNTIDETGEDTSPLNSEAITSAYYNKSETDSAINGALTKYGKGKRVTFTVQQTSSGSSYFTYTHNLNSSNVRLLLQTVYASGTPLDLIYTIDTSSLNYSTIYVRHGNGSNVTAGTSLILDIFTCIE